MASLTVLPSALEAQFVSGKYTGNGNDDRAVVTQLGFQPDVVIIKGDNTSVAAVCTSTMGANLSKVVAANAVGAGHIKSLDSNGFTVGTTANVNTDTVNYYWIAFKQVAGKVKVSSYTGNATDNTNISGVGFQPDFVIVMSADAYAPAMRSSSMAGDTSHFFSSSAATSNLIQALQADGFQVGSDNIVNRNNTTNYYIAWKVTAGEMYVNSRTGDGNDNTNISGVGFTPEWVIITSDGIAAAHHSSAVGPSTDSSQNFNGVANGANKIQALQADGFQVGTASQVNTNATAYYYMCFARSAPTAVKLADFSARRHGGRVRLSWRTGLEADNLGFHIWRDDGGRTVRLTRDLVAGSALFSGPGTVMTCGRSYALWDDGPKAGRGRYWLEEVDLQGKSTWHGPFRVEDGGEEGETEAEADGPGSSKLLGEVGRAEAAMGCGATRSRALELRSLPRKRVNVSLECEGEDRDPREVQWDLAAAPALKLLVREEGWYRIEEPELLSAGLDGRGGLRFLRLFSQGVEEPLAVRKFWNGCRGGRYAVEFHGEGLESPSADARTYWLVKGSEPGKRLRAGSPAGAGLETGARSFPFEVERKERTVYFAGVKNGGRENFFGPPISREPVEEALVLHHLDPSPPGDPVLEVSLQGLTAGGHQVEVSLNGTRLGESVFEGQEIEERRWALPPGSLVEGENRVMLAPAGEEGDVSLPERVRITYWHTYTADEDALRCTVPGRQLLRIGGFKSPRIRAVDLSEPGTVRLLRVSVEKEPGGYAARLRVGGPTTLYAFGGYAVARPWGIAANLPSRWHEEDREGDEVIIAERSLLESLEPLRALRESQGYKVAVVDVEDAYDEFSFGEKDPAAIKEFLRRAGERWKVPPRFVLLVGDSSFDPLDRLGRGDRDLVPTKLVDTAALETASDDWFVDFDDDSLPDLAVGRLPVRTAEEASRLVAKIVEHETASPGGSEVVLVSDANKGFDFEAENVWLEGMVPGGLPERSIYRGRVGTGEARSDLLQGLKDGPLLVNYVGHGSVELWGGNLLTTGDMAGLSTGRRPSFFVLMTCLNGFFHDLYTESLAEGLLNRTGSAGALAVWASTGFTSPGSHGEMDRELFRLLFEEGLTPGEAAARAKAAAFDPDVRRTWVFFGDPASPLR